MLKKTIMAIIAIGVITLSGCSLFTTTSYEEPQPTIAPTPTPTPVVVEPIYDLYDSGIPSDAPFNEVWSSPATYSVENYYAGYTLKFIIRVHNGNAVPTPFSVLYAVPDNVDVGYNAPTNSVQYWVNISERYPVIEAYGTKMITVTLTMPEGAIAPANHWLFWVCVKDISQNTMVQTRLCTKFKITMEQ